MYKCADGKEFVNHLEGYSDEMRDAVEKAGPRTMLAAIAKEVRRPGEKAWISMQKDPAKYAKTAMPRCPDGSRNATLVVPP